MNLAICCAVGDPERYGRCLGDSIQGQIQPGDEFVTMLGKKSLAHTYAEMEKTVQSDVCVFVHEDLTIRAPFIEHLRAELEALDKLDPEWGLFGIAGTVVPVSREFADRVQEEAIRFIEYQGWGEGSAHIIAYADIPPLIKSFSEKQEHIVNIRDQTYHNSGSCHLRRVQAIDSLLIAKKRNDEIAWDVNIPGFAAGVAEDMSLQAAQKNKGVYVTPLYAEHDTIQRSQLAEGYLKGREYIMKKWQCRPIITTAGVWF